MKTSRRVFLWCVLGAFLFGQEAPSAGELVSAGMTAYSQGDYADAIDYFKKAAELRPDNSTVVYNIACCYALENVSDSALGYLRKAIALGVYKFDDDEDFASLFDNAEFQDLSSACNANITELESKEWLPVVYIPEDYTSEDEYPMVIALHGFGSNPDDFARAFDSVVTRNGYLFCCPYGPEVRGTTAFGWDGESAMNARVRDAYEYMKRTYAVDTTRIVLLGYSQGGYHAFRIGLQNPAAFMGVITVAGFYNDEFDALVTADRGVTTKFYIMIGEMDRSYESNLHADSIFHACGIHSRLMSYPEMGHAFPSDKGEVIKALKWLETAE